MDEQLFFEKLFINSELSEQICSHFGIDVPEYRKLSLKMVETRSDEITKIKRIRSLYHNKKGSNFRFATLRDFYDWYNTQHKKQEGKCFYCGTDELIIRSLMEKKFAHRKRINRGNFMEVERRDAKGNIYDKDNCVLACYFCNNDKSDIFMEDEYLEYLKDRKGFFLKEFDKLK